MVGSRRQDLYVAIIGDMVGSRQVEDRAALQGRLTALMDEVNRAHAGSIAARFVITVGDEFQGLLSRWESCRSLLAELRVGLHPVEVRFGIGLGGLATPLQPEAIGMDGPCLHRARKAVERADDRATPLEVETGEDQPAFEIYSLLLAELRGSWTDRQRQVADLALTGLAGKDIAQRLQISQPAVSQHLKRVGLDRLRKAGGAWDRAMGRAFAEMGKGISG